MNSTKQQGTCGDASVRLNRYLSMCGLGSRRKCDELIAAGHIFRNGERVTELGVQVIPGTDRIEYMGRILREMKAHEYFAYYKPREVMVTANDPQGRTTIYDALKKRVAEVNHLRYAGRLDYQSEGLILLTNDGELIHALTHPRFHIKKVYHVKVERLLDDNETRRLIDGVESEEQLLRAASVKQLSLTEEHRRQYWYEIELFEGKNRQLRRMFEGLNILVGRIRRVRFGSVQLAGLQPGEIRPLTERELGALRNTGYKIPHVVKKSSSASGRNHGKTPDAGGRSRH